MNRLSADLSLAMSQIDHMHAFKHTSTLIHWLNGVHAAFEAQTYKRSCIRAILTCMFVVDGQLSNLQRIVAQAGSRMVHTQCSMRASQLCINILCPMQVHSETLLRVYTVSLASDWHVLQGSKNSSSGLLMQMNKDNTVTIVYIWSDLCWTARWQQHQHPAQCTQCCFQQSVSCATAYLPQIQ